MEIGKKYQVTPNHPFHANKCGTFEFMGGPNANAVVLELREQRTSHSKTYIAVREEDIINEQAGN